MSPFLVVVSLALVLGACGQGTTSVEVSGPQVVPRSDSGLPDSLGQTQQGDGANATFELAPVEGSGDDGFKLNLGNESDPGTSAGTAAGAPALLSMVEQGFQSDDAYSFQVSVTMDLEVDGERLVTPRNQGLANGRVNGGLTETNIDLSAFLGTLSAADAAALGSDLTMNLITDQNNGHVYMRAPFLGNMLEPALRNGPPEMQPLLVLKDGWGVVDANLAANPDMADLLSTDTGSLTEILEILKTASADIENLGVGQVAGVTGTHYRASVTLGALLDSQGQGDLLDGFGSANNLANLRVPYDVWIDDQDRLVAVQSLVDIVELGRAANLTVNGSAGEFGYLIVINYDDDSVITLPAATDLTAAFTYLLQF